MDVKRGAGERERAMVSIYIQVSASRQGESDNHDNPESGSNLALTKDRKDKLMMAVVAEP